MSTVDGVELPVRREHPWVGAQRTELRFGLAWAPHPSPDWAICRDLVQLAEGLGYDSYWWTGEEVGPRHGLRELP